MSELLASPRLLRKIDQLRELNIGTMVPLPQMVVVGDQSSGKSSLLESLTNIPFPTDAELCTRYATQITSRRDIESRVEISLIPGPSASAERRKKLSEFNHPHLTPTEFRAKFPELLREVNLCLGIRTDINDDSNATGTVFTDDVLKIEICSPEEDYLTIIDVPGIFRNPQGITTRNDMAMVRKMVENYVKDRRTIILAVLPSNVDIATQEILSLAEDYDPKGERTLGVLTKPDTITERSGKNVICNLVLGKKKPLTLGYYVVRNRGADEDTSISLAQRELMFNEAPWNTLPKERVGISALKSQLTQLLSEITKREYGPLRQEIIDLQNKNQQALVALGLPRETDQQQRAYLSSIAGKFQDLVNSALTGHYARDDAFDKDSDLRLSTVIVNRADEFVEQFSKKGHEWKFAVSDDQEGGESDLETSSALVLPAAADNQYCDSDGESSPSDEKSSSATMDASLFGSDGLDEFLHDMPEFRNPQLGIKRWIKDVYRRYRGPELCSFGSSILCSAFKEQSQRWDSFAKAYVSDCIRTIHLFLRRALAILCPKDLANEIWSFISDEVIARYKHSLETAVFLTRVERTLNPYTLNPYFSSEVHEARSDRLCDQLRQRQVTAPYHQTSSQFSNANIVTVDLATLYELSNHKANVDHLNDEIHDSLRAYYKVAEKRFLDNLYLQAVDYCLMNGDKSPLRVFSQEWVISLSAAQLELLVGDSAKTRAQRDRLNTRRVDLNEAIRILRE
ncbi:hypothetical protein jhhlp_005916 [Lomentospora prolificans]|uniref:GED domain-containing protein n=1 Tax=Lomentospora prolificans TaxID=41688 RepID=A0A2N3N4H3_9PEZI|nr:hypothetical protein jhhlp_005916 [Lomentospora prolificans]